MRKLLTTTTLIIGLAFLSVTYADKPANNKKKTAPTKTAAPSALTNLSLSFIQTARAAILRAIPNEPENYILTLYDVNPYTTYFSRRPNRVSGIATSEDFVKAWKVGENNFEIDNPNGLIIPCEIDGATNKSETFYIVRLASPVYKTNKKGLINIQYAVKSIGSRNIIYKHIRFDYVTLIIG